MTNLAPLLDKFGAPAQTTKRKTKMSRTQIEDFVYLKAMKLGEKEEFDNSEPSDSAPSNRPTYKKLTYIMQELNKQLGAPELALRSNGNVLTIYRESEGEKSVALPRPATGGSNRGKTYKVGPRKKKGEVSDELKAYIASQLASVKPATGNEWWLVNDGGATVLAFASPEDAKGYCALMGLDPSNEADSVRVLHVREV